METAHLPFVVQEHLRYFPDGFFARLGGGFLTCYTRTYLTSPYATGLIAEIRDQPVGFLVGTVDSAAHRQYLLRFHCIPLALRALPALAARPPLMFHFLHTRLPRYCHRLLAQRPQEDEDAGCGTTAAREAVLAHLAVVPEARGQGVGGALIDNFTRFAVLAGCERMSLVTASGQEGAGPYYERRGWQPWEESRTPEGRRLLTYVRFLSGLPGGRAGDRDRE